LEGLGVAEIVDLYVVVAYGSIHVKLLAAVPVEVVAVEVLVVTAVGFDVEMKEGVLTSVAWAAVAAGAVEIVAHGSFHVKLLAVVPVEEVVAVGVLVVTVVGFDVEMEELLTSNADAAGAVGAV